MYHTPRVERFGTFRDLTLGGDGKRILGNDFCLGQGDDLDPPDGGDGEPITVLDTPVGAGSSL